MNHPGPYIPTTHNRIGARIEWLARLALWEAHEAASEARRRMMPGGAGGSGVYEYAQQATYPWHVTQFPDRIEFNSPALPWWGRGVMSDPRRRDYERAKNAAMQSVLDRAYDGAQNNPNPYSGAGMGNAYRYTADDDGTIRIDEIPRGLLEWPDAAARQVAFPGLASEVTAWARKWGR